MSCEDISTDGKWCYIVFWVVCKPTTRWDSSRWELLKKRLIGACPSCFSASGISYYCSELQHPKPPDVFLLKLCCYDRKGLLHGKLLLLLGVVSIPMKFWIDLTDFLFYFFLSQGRFILLKKFLFGVFFLGGKINIISNFGNPSSLFSPISLSII